MIYEETDEYREVESWEGKEMATVNRLEPLESYLTFNPAFITACALTPPVMNCLGFYCNGWEL